MGSLLGTALVVFPVVGYIIYRLMYRDYLISLSSESNVERLNKYYEGSSDEFDKIPGKICREFNFEEFKKFLNIESTVKHLLLGNHKELYNNMEDTYITSKFICINDTIVIPKSYEDYKQILKYCKEYFTIHNPNDSTAIPDVVNANYRLYDIINATSYFKDVINDFILFKEMPYNISNSEFNYFDEESKIVYSHKYESISPFEMIIILLYVKKYLNREEDNIRMDVLLKELHEELRKFVYHVKSEFHNEDVTFWCVGNQMTDAEVRRILFSTFFKIETKEVIDYLKNYKNVNAVYRIWGDIFTDTIDMERTNALHSLGIV